MPELVCSADDPRWLEERRRGVTATDIVAIIGLSVHQSAYSLYYEKTSAIPAKPDNDRWRLGRQLEGYIAERWLEETGTDRRAFVHGGLRRSSERPWQLATLDRMSVMKENSGVPLELKSWADADRHAWDDTPPPAVRAQVLWQMDTLDVPRGHIGVLFLPSGEFRSYVIEHHPSHVDRLAVATSDYEHDCDLCQDITLMRVAGAEFNLRVLGKLGPPSPDGSSATLAALKARFLPKEGPAADIDPAAWDGLVAYRKLSRDYKVMAREFEALIREQLGESTRLKVGGLIVGKRITGQSKVREHVRVNDYIRVLGGDDDE